MKRILLALLMALTLYSCPGKLCIGERLDQTCGIFEATPINDGKTLIVRVSEVGEYDQISIVGRSSDTTVELKLKDDTAIVFNRPFAYLMGEMKAKCIGYCSEYIVWPIMLITSTLKLNDTTYNAVEVDTGGNLRVVKGNKAVPPYIKFIKTDADIYVIGNGIKVSYPGSFKIAPDTGYYDTLVVSGEHALWITSGSQMFGKLKVLEMYEDSIKVQVGFRKYIKGLRWIETE